MRMPTRDDDCSGLLCLMYLITYVDRVNIATAASDIRSELGLSNTQLGFVQSAFAYPYLLFRCSAAGSAIGSARAERCSCAASIWAARDDPDRTRGRADVAVSRAACCSASARARRSRWRRARCKAGRPLEQSRLRAGHHPLVRAPRQRGHAADRRVADRGDHVARSVRRARIVQPDLGGRLAAVASATTRRSIGRSRRRSSIALPNRGAAGDARPGRACRGARSRDAWRR